MTEHPVGCEAENANNVFRFGVSRKSSATKVTDYGLGDKIFCSLR
jgi:hypothetical protein